MAVDIKLKRSAVPGKVPTTQSLDLGELALNTYDGRAFFKKSVNGRESIVELATVPTGSTTGVTKIKAGTNITISPSTGVGEVTINAQTGVADTALYAETAGEAETAQYAENAGNLDGYDSTDFAFIALPNIFTAENKFESNVYVTGSTSITGSLYVNGPITASNLFVSGDITAQRLIVSIISSSVIYSSGSNIFGDNINDTQTLIGQTSISGSLSVTDSLVATGSHQLLGSTLISGSLTISSSQNQTPATFQIYGDIRQKGATYYQPVDITLNPSLSGSYIFSSGSTNDLYFVQNSKGFSSTTRLRWLEGNLYTGLLNGGLLSTTTGSTVFNVSSGSGIIVTLNASLNDEPYPTVKYLKWDNITNIPLTYLTSSIQTYIGVDSNNNIIQQTTPFQDGEYNTKILLGTVLHQNQTTTNGSITYPNVAYGYKQRTYDFIKAFGPLKLSGLNIIPSGSLGLTVGSGTAWADGRNYQVDPNNPSYITDPGTNVSKIFRYYQSGSSFVQDTNGGLGYTSIDPGNYNPGGSGSLQPVPGTGANREWSLQRVFWYPNSTTKGIVVYYGTKTYPTLVDAVANIPYEPFFEVENTKQNAVYLGAIAIRNNGDFTDANSYSISAGGVFRSVGGSGGGGSAPAARFVDLADVTITGPTDGQTVIYDATDLKWINSSFISASISGNAATATSASWATTASYALNAEGGSYKSPIVGSSSYTVTHSLNEDYPIVQVYNAEDKQQVLPAVIQSINSNTVYIEFSSIFSGSVIIKK